MNWCFDYLVGGWLCTAGKYQHVGKVVEVHGSYKAFDKSGKLIGVKTNLEDAQQLVELN